MNIKLKNIAPIFLFLAIGLLVGIITNKLSYYIPSALVVGGVVSIALEKGNIKK